MNFVYRGAVRILLVLTALVFAVMAVLVQRPGLFLGETKLQQSTLSEQVVNPDLAEATAVLDLTGDAPRSGTTPPRTVAITFDDGPDPMWTPRIQEVLDRHGVPGTFFVIGKQVVDHPDVVRALDAAGHEIGNHSFTHPKLGQLADWQVRLQYSLTQNAVVAAIGKAPQVFRPPYSGSAPFLPPDEYAAAATAARELGLVCLLSDRIPRDYDLAVPVETLVAQALPPTGAGSVLVFHDGGGTRANTVEALDRVITILKDNGYRFVTASEFAGLTSPPASTGVADRFAGQLLAASHVTVWVMRIFVVLGVAFVAYSVLRLTWMSALAVVQLRREKRAPGGEPFLEPVSVVVPAYNEEVGIAAGVRSIACNMYPDVEVIVVDDGSTDRTAAAVDELGLPNVRVVRQANAGKPVALNTGVAMASHEIVVMVDGDTVFEPRTICNLVRPFADPMVGAVAGNAKVGNRIRLWPRLQHLEYTVASALERRSYTVLGSTGCVPGAIGAFRKTTLREVGGVSPDTLAEDADLTMAIARAGWSVEFAPDARAWTEVPSTLRGVYRQRFRWAYGVLQSLAKHRRAVVEGGAGGRLGRRVMPQQVMGYVGALIGPVLDFLVVLTVAVNPRSVSAILGAWVALNVALVAASMFALRLERERLWVAFLAPMQQLIYRQVVYVAVVRAIGAALCGIRLPWNKVQRTGNVSIASNADDDGLIIDLRERHLVGAVDA